LLKEIKEINVMENSSTRSKVCGLVLRLHSSEINEVTDALEEIESAYLAFSKSQYLVEFVENLQTLENLAFKAKEKIRALQRDNQTEL